MVFGLRAGSIRLRQLGLELGGSGFGGGFRVTLHPKPFTSWVKDSELLARVGWVYDLTGFGAWAFVVERLEFRV